MRHLYQACPTWYKCQEVSSHPAQLRRSAGLIVAGRHPGVDYELTSGLSAVQHEGAADEHEPAVLVALRLIALRHARGHGCRGTHATSCMLSARLLSSSIALAAHKLQLQSPWRLQQLQATWIAASRHNRPCPAPGTSTRGGGSCCCWWEVALTVTGKGGGGSGSRARSSASIRP